MASSNNEYMAEFAENLWNNYIKPKMREELRNAVTFYKATITANPGNGTLTVQRPYDNAVTISCSDDLKSAAVGSQVVVFVLGGGNAANSVAISAKGLKDIKTKSS